MSESGYQGWSNYQTWCVNLWIDNDEALQTYWLATAQEAWDSTEASRYLTREDEAVREVETQLKDWLDEQASDCVGNASMLSDLLTSATHYVNCREIAEHWIADVDKDAHEDEDEDEDATETE